MPALKIRRNNEWHRYGIVPPLTVSLLQPSTSGQTHNPGFFFSFGTDDNARVALVELFYLLAGEPVLVGSTTENTYGYAVPVPLDFPVGTNTWFGRVTTDTGDKYDSPQVSMTLEEKGPPVTVTMLQPSSSGQTFELPFTAAFGVSDNAAVSKVELYRADPAFGFQKLGEATAIGPVGWAVEVPEGFQVGPHELWGRAVLGDGTGGVDSPHRTLTFTDTPDPTLGGKSLQTAIVFGGNDAMAAQAEKRIGHKLTGRMKFAQGDIQSNRLKDVTGEVNKLTQPGGRGGYMLWHTYALALKAENLRNINYSNFSALGAQLNRLTVDDLRFRYGIRLGWEFQGDWFPWGVQGSLSSSSAKAAPNGKDQRANAAAYVNAFKKAVDAMRNAMSQAKADALRLDWNGSGGRMFRKGTQGGINHWTLTDMCYPGDNYVDVISCDVYNGDQHREGIGLQNFVEIDGADAGPAYCRSRAIQHGKKSGMSEGGPCFIKWKQDGPPAFSGGPKTWVFHGAMPAANGPNVKFLNRLLNWGQIEADAGRLSNITFFERDKGEGRFMFWCGVEPPTANSFGGSEGALSLWPGATGTTGHPGTPSPPDMRGNNARAYTGVGSSRSGSNNVQSNDPYCLNAFLDRVGGVIR